jgi:hypothetical protein
MRRRARGWSDFDTDEKLDALRNDVNRALDVAEELKKSLKQTRDEMMRLGAIVFQMKEQQK